MASGRPALLVITSTYPRSATDVLPRFVHDLSKRLTPSFELHVLAPSTPGAAANEEMDGVHVHRFRYCFRSLETLANVEGFLPALKSQPWRALLLPLFFGSEVWAIGKLARYHKVSLLHAHWIVPQGLAAWLAIKLWRLSLPLVVTCHGADLFALNGRLFRFLKRKVLSEATALTVVSEAARKRALNLGASPGRLFVYPMGVDLTHRFTPERTVARARATMLFVGRLNEKKGANILIRALALVRKQWPDARLHIAGYGPDQTSLQALTKALSLTEAVHFHGAVTQEELPDLYRRATCLVFPSVVARSGDQEGLGLVPIEALGCGCPVIASRLPAVADVIEDGRTGWLFTPADSHDLARKILHVLRHRDESLQMARAGRDKVVSRNDWTLAAEHYEQLIADTLGNSAQRKLRCRSG